MSAASVKVSPVPRNWPVAVEPGVLERTSRAVPDMRPPDPQPGLRPAWRILTPLVWASSCSWPVADIASWTAAVDHGDGPRRPSSLVCTAISIAVLPPPITTTRCGRPAESRRGRIRLAQRGDEIDGVADARPGPRPPGASARTPPRPWPRNTASWSRRSVAQRGPGRRRAPARGGSRSRRGTG